MAPGLQVTSEATGEPFGIQELKDHLRVTSNAEDTLIDNLITSSRVWFENETNVTSMDRTYQYTLDEFPVSEMIELPRAPLASTNVTITYAPASGGTQTIDSTNLLVDDQSPRPRVVLKDDEDWPDTELARINAVRVSFTAGYGTTSGSSSVPRLMKQGMQLLAGHWYENREGTTIRGSVEEMPMAVQSIVWHFRLVDVP